MTASLATHTPLDTPSAAPAPWFARLDLEFDAVGDRTVLAHQQHIGPLRVQRSFYPEGSDCAHTYLLHPPGGVASADELMTTVRVRPRAHALLTSPGAMKLYRSNGIATATIQNRLCVAPNATLEWLPAETIVFDGARVALDTDIQLSEGSRFIGWDIVCFGRPAIKERYRVGSFNQLVRIRRGSQTIMLERTRLGEDKSWLHKPWGASNKPVVATLIATTHDPSALDVARRQPAVRPDELFAVTCTQSDLLIARFLGHSVERAHAVMSGLWEALRPTLLQRAPCSPRIWKT